MVMRRKGIGRLPKRGSEVTAKGSDQARRKHPNPKINARGMPRMQRKMVVMMMEIINL